VQQGQILLLRGGEIAEFTFGALLGGDIGGNFLAKGIGSRDVGGGQARGNSAWFCAAAMTRLPLCVRMAVGIWRRLLILVLR
jgi:hypothetical protein